MYENELVIFLKNERNIEISHETSNQIIEIH